MQLGRDGEDWMSTFEGESRVFQVMGAIAVLLIVYLSMIRVTLQGDNRYLRNPMRKN